MRDIKVEELIDKELKVKILYESYYFDEYVKSLSKSLETYNINVSFGKSMNSDEPVDVVIFVGITIRLKNLLKKVKKSGIITALILTEQPYSRQVGFFSRGKQMVERDKKLIPYADIVYVWSKEQQYLYEKLHKNVVLLPYFYMPEYDYSEKYDGIEKKYDLLFLGDPTSFHRKVLLDSLEKKYNVIYSTFNKNEIWGEDKYRLIHESKICLNIHQEVGCIMEKPRMYEYFSNKAFVLSESIKWPEPFNSGEDYDLFYYSDVFNKIDYYLDHDEERINIATNAYTKVKKETVEKATCILLDRILMELAFRESKKNKESLGHRILRPYRYLKWKVDTYKQKSR